MKAYFKLGKLQEVKVWLDESPVQTFVSKNNLLSVIPVTERPSKVFHSEVVVEFKQPRGPRCVYGLLGAKFKPSHNGDLSIEVGDGLADPRVYDESLQSVIEVSKYGLPKGIASAILEVLKMEVLKRGVSVGGSFEVCYGAYGEVSSNQQVFKLLARNVLEFFLLKALMVK
ncbi:hypothetical protein [Pseudomonas sp. MWU12-2323]|uniref:hypothetical protein n=2 Tax=Pseudomonas TaxID=286 RepID=UPI00128D8C88|nr:hypothetical protein [Pseudomonas sp. MWU12-2323]MPQ71798.1 hypothetical protein [Pseudomonas sp. MWU12-2323]